MSGGVGVGTDGVDMNAAVDLERSKKKAQVLTIQGTNAGRKLVNIGVSNADGVMVTAAKIVDKQPDQSCLYCPLVQVMPAQCISISTGAEVTWSAAMSY